MTHQLKRSLNKISDKQFFEDIKSYISFPYRFFDERVPELKTMAIKLNEEHSLKDFYKIFDKLWNSGYNREMSLALYTLQLYEKDFDSGTWEFLKDKLIEMKSQDQIEVISKILGNIMLKYPEIQKDVLKFSNTDEIRIKKIIALSTLYLVRKGYFDFAIKLAEKNKNYRDSRLQVIINLVLKEIAKQKPELIKKFLLKSTEDINIEVINSNGRT
jgi:hypothetical protein